MNYFLTSSPFEPQTVKYKFFYLEKMLDIGAYKIFVNKVPNALAMFDCSMEYIAASPEWIKSFKLDKEEIIGKSQYEVFPYISEEWKKIYKECLAGVEINGQDTPFTIHDGSEQWINWHIRPWFDRENKVGGLLVYSQDVTQRKQTEEKLKETAQRLLLATKGSKLGIWDQDITNNTLVWDEGMFRLYGLNPQNFGGNFESWISLVHPADRDLIHRKAGLVMQGKEDFDVVFRIIRPDKSIRYIKALALLQRDSKGNPIRLVGTNLDITDSKEYEKTLEQISFDISHVIRRPITSILGLTSILEKEDIDANFIKEYSGYIKIVAQELDEFTSKLNTVYQEKKMNRRGPV